MLAAELRGDAYSKAEHRRGLLKLLDGRSEGAIERKHGNISAVLIELGFPYIEGYKPFVNYQELLFEVVSERIGSADDLKALVVADVEAPASTPSVEEILSALVSAPTGRAESVRETQPVWETRPVRRSPVDYLKLEAQNRSLGAAGETFVLNFEKARLIAADREELASRIEHVSQTRGDGDGFDVLSFDDSGEERLIEVKTTRYGAQTPFYITPNELRVSEREADRYHLYRVFGFRRAPRLFDVPGAVSSRFSLAPSQFIARVS